MQMNTKIKKSDSLENPIVIDAQDTITGLTLEHGYIDEFINSLGGNVESIEQNLIYKDNRRYDQVIVTMDDGSERELFFDVSSFFGEI
jgi:hypothetical protein